jgi:hypothetical protein
MGGEPSDSTPSGQLRARGTCPVSAPPSASLTGERIAERLPVNTRDFGSNVPRAWADNHQPGHRQDARRIEACRRSRVPSHCRRGMIDLFSLSHHVFCFGTSCLNGVQYTTAKLTRRAPATRSARNRGLRGARSGAAGVRLFLVRKFEAERKRQPPPCSLPTDGSQTRNRKPQGVSGIGHHPARTRSCLRRGLHPARRAHPELVPTRWPEP